MPSPDRRDGLVILGGLPGVGKTTIARALARCLGAVHLRVDSIEVALAQAGVAQPMNALGYVAAYAVARDQLALGLSVVADSVNPVQLTRQAWCAVAESAGVPHVEVEVRCSDGHAHRHRVEHRDADLPGLTLPTWAQVCQREYQPWDADVVVDTAGISGDQAVAQILAALPWRGAR